ncbi:MAG: hypothetical protein ACOC28_06245 [Alkalispirochaetaceae bacterium]
MNRSVRATLIVVLLSALLGCANIYEANLFADFDGPPSASELANASIDEIAEAAESPQFFDELANDPEAKETIQNRLQEIYNDTNASDEDRRSAAILSGDVEMETTAGGEVVNNVVDVLLSGDGDFSDPATLVESIFPESIRNDPTALREQLESFQTASEAYQVYGDDLDSEGVPEGANSGEIAQRATVAILINTLAVEAGGVDALASDIENDNLGGYSDPTEDALGTESAPTSLRNILDVAGLTGVVEGG